jgi:hypothetical protein
MRDALPLYKRAVSCLAVILGVCGGVIIWAVQYWPHVAWLQTHGPNFGADFIGLSITLLLVDRIVAWRRDGELHPLRQSAIRRIGRAVRDLEIQMAWVYQAASPAGYEPDTVDDLIDEFVDAISRLDFAALVSAQAPTPWRVFLPQRLEQISVQLDRAVTRHEELLSPRLAAAVDAVVDDPALRLLRNESGLSLGLSRVNQDDLIPQRRATAAALKEMYRAYAEFRHRDYALVAWELPRDWSTAVRPKSK